MHMQSGISYALMAAVLFGASTPLAKLLLGEAAPVLIAGLLYLGSGVGLSLWLLLRRLGSYQGQAMRSGPSTPPALTVPRKDVPWLIGAVTAGGIAAPVLLMSGLAITPAAPASLLLNMEGVLTAVLAWFVFHEQFDRRVFIGMLLIVAAGILLAWPVGDIPAAGSTATVPASGALLIVAACLCWAIDNNLTRKISANDAVLIAAIKGMAAAVVNLGIAAAMQVPWPSAGTLAATMITGLLGYGVSLVMFVIALRLLGTARTGAYFSAAPFAGALLSLLLLREVPGALFWPAALLMAIGLWLHVTERHAHLHTHEPMQHTHPHTHDEHHQHAHGTSDPIPDGGQPHTHAHQHDELTHQHPHYPDLHHRHRH